MKENSEDTLQSPEQIADQSHGDGSAIQFSKKMVSQNRPHGDEQHSAAVSAISPVIDANGMVHIEATLAPHPHLMPGMTAFVTKVK